MFEMEIRINDSVKEYLSVKEEPFVMHLLAMQETPSPKMLIKDQKVMNNKGQFPTILVITAKHFTDTFSKLGILG